MLPIPVTICLTGIFALMLVALSLNVSLRRRDLRLALGDGGDQALIRRIRAHGNFVETAPFCILIVLALEGVLASSTIIWLVAGLFVLARCFHAYGTLGGGTQRVILSAMLIQHGTMILSAIWLLFQTVTMATATS